VLLATFNHRFVPVLVSTICHIFPSFPRFLTPTPNLVALTEGDFLVLFAGAINIAIE
jgi:hypothetical protein